MIHLRLRPGHGNHLKSEKGNRWRPTTTDFVNALGLSDHGVRGTIILSSCYYHHLIFIKIYTVHFSVNSYHMEYDNYHSKSIVIVRSRLHRATKFSLNLSAVLDSRISVKILSVCSQLFPMKVDV